MGHRLQRAAGGAWRIRCVGSLVTHWRLLALAVVIACGAPRETVRPRVALIIDDFGYVAPAVVDSFLALDVPLTIAVLPYQQYSRLSAERGDSAGKEVILHLPMEGRAGSNPGPDALLDSLSESEVRVRTRRALDDVPHLVGANNHMGSVFTADSQRMRWMMEEIAARRLYFLDSRTGPRSTGDAIARTLGVRTARRDVFLDNERTPEAIARQWALVLERARAQGSAVAIGHVYPETLAALRELLPQSRGEVDFVLASTLAR